MSPGSYELFVWRIQPHLLGPFLRDSPTAQHQRIQALLLLAHLDVDRSSVGRPHQRRPAPIFLPNDLLISLIPLQQSNLTAGQYRWMLNPCSIAAC